MATWGIISQTSMHNAKGFRSEWPPALQGARRRPPRLALRGRLRRSSGDEEPPAPHRSGGHPARSSGGDPQRGPALDHAGRRPDGLQGELEALLAGVEASLGDAIFVIDNATVVKGWRERIWEKSPAAGLPPLGNGGPSCIGTSGSGSGRHWSSARQASSWC